MVEKIVELKMKLVVVGDEAEIDELVNNVKKLEHHIDYLVDTADWPEIDTIYDVQVKEVKE